MTQRLYRGLLVGLLLALLTPVPVYAVQESNIRDTYPGLGRSVRALGMGNAVLTMKGRHTTDMLYNPAALRDLAGNWEFSALGTQASVNQKLVTTLKDVFTMVNDLDDSGTTTGDVNVFNTFFNNHVGEFHSVDLTETLFTMGRRDWGFGVLADVRTSISMRNRAFANFELRSRNDTAFVAGRSVGLLGSDLVVGLLAKGLYRIERDKVIATSDVIGGSVGSSFKFSNWGKAMGIGADLGARYRLPLDVINPTVAVVYQDVANTRFFGADTSDNLQSLNAAVGVHPQFGDVDVSVEVGLTDINRRRSLLMRSHAGVEVRLPPFAATQLSLRGGMNEGYPAGGLSLDWPVASLDAAFFGEESGAVSRRGAIYKFATGFNLYF